MSGLKFALSLGAVVLATAFAAPSSARAEAGWCAYAGGGQQYENCGYYTLAQCRAAVHGVGGDCRRNPRVRAYEYDETPPPAPRRRYRRDY